MGIPFESLPERKHEILRPGARLQITLTERGGTSEVVIVGIELACKPFRQSVLALRN